MCIIKIGVIIFLLTVTVMPVGIVATPPEQKSNTQYESEKQIDIGDKITGDVTNNSIDRFVFTARRGSEINIIAPDEDNKAIKLKIYDRNGTVLTDEDVVSDNQVEITQTAPYTGEYTVRVAPKEDSNRGSYNFTVITPIPRDGTQIVRQHNRQIGLQIMLIGSSIAIIIPITFAVWKYRIQ